MNSFPASSGQLRPKRLNFDQTDAVAIPDYRAVALRKSCQSFNDSVRDAAGRAHGKIATVTERQEKASYFGWDRMEWITYVSPSMVK